MANQLALNPYDKYANEPYDPNRKVDLRPEMSEFGKGVRAFGDESQAIGGGLLALGAQHLKSVTPDNFGEKYLEPASEYGLDVYKRNMEEATFGQQAPKVSKFEDIGETGSVGDFVGYQLGKGLPNLAALGVGGIVGRQVAKKAIGSATKDILGTEVGKNLVGRQVTQGVKDKATAEVKKILTRGEVVGGFATGAGYEGGAAFGEAIEEGADPERAKWAATGIGGLSGALEFLPLYKVAKSLGAGDVAKKSIRKVIKGDKILRNLALELSGRAAKAGSLGAGVEGLTEGMQQLVNIAGVRWAKEDPMFADLSDEDWSQVQNAIVAGGLVGGVAGGGLGTLASPKQEPKSDIDLKQVVGKKPEEVINQQESVAEPEIIEEASSVVDPVVEPIITQPKAIEPDVVEPLTKVAEADVEVGKNKQGEIIYQDVDDYQYTRDKGELVYLDDTNAELFEKQDEIKEEAITYGQDNKGNTVRKKQEVNLETESRLEAERKGQGSFVEGTVTTEKDTEVFKSPRAAEAAMGREGLANAEVVEKDNGWIIKTNPQGKKQTGLELTEGQALARGLVDNPKWFKDSEGLWQEKQVKGKDLDLDFLASEGGTQSRFEGKDVNLVAKTSDQMREEARKFIDPKTVDKLEQAGILNFTNEASTDNAQGEFDLNRGVFNIYGGSQVEGDNVASVILHESSHSGLDRLLGGKLEGFNKDILKQAEAGNKVAQAAKEKLFGKEKVPNKLNFQAKEELAAWYIQLSQESNQQSGLSRRMTDTLKAKFRETSIGRAARAVGIDFQLTPELAVEYAHMAVGNSLNLAKELDRLGAPRVGSKLEQDIQVKEGVSKGEVKTLSDVLESNILFDNDSELKGQKVEFKYMGLDKAHTQGDTIYLSSELDNTNINSLKPALLKELDWLAQDKEGWRGFEASTNLVDFPILNQARKLAKTISDVNAQGMNVLREAEQLVNDPKKANEIERLLYRGLTQGLEGRVSKQFIDFVGDEQKLFSRAFHGTPHDIDKFLMEKIGTGEGAQAQGHGLYFADDKGVGQWYRDKLKEDGTKGNLYEVDLKPEQDQYLDWTKPLTEQSDYVKNAIINSGMGSYITDEMTGNKFYNELSKFYAVKNLDGWLIDKSDSQRRVSNELLEIGIRGNKYLDSSSRKAGEGNYNYVIFNEDDVEIINKLQSKAGDIKGDLANLADNLYVDKQALKPIIGTTDLSDSLQSTIFDSPDDFRRAMYAKEDNPREQYELGTFQTWYVKFIDSFATIEKKDEGIKDVFDLAESKRATKIDEINRRFVEPLVKLVDESGIKLEEVNDWIAARSIFLDNANLDMSERASHEFINRLLPRLTKEKQDEVKEKRDKILEGKDNKEAQIRMYALMEEYFQHERIEEGKDETSISSEWQLFKQHASGMFIKGEGLVNTANAPDAEEIYNRHLNNTKIDEIATVFDQLTKHQLDLLEEGGNITQAEQLAMIKDKPHYAPLRREAFDYEKTFDFLNQKGFGPSKGISVRYGSANASKPVHVIQNTLARAHAAAATAQKNLANNFLYEQIKENELNWKEWFTVGNDTTQAATDELGFVKKKKTSNLNPTDIRLIRKGKRLIISPIEQNERATVFAAAVNKLGAQQHGSVSKVFGWVNSIVRFTAVSASPAFLMANLIRDPLTAVYNMQASEAESHTKEIIGSYGKTFKALMDVYWKGNRDPANLNVQMVERWEKAGGRISFVESLREMDTSIKSFDAKVKIEGTPGVKTIVKMANNIEKANIIVENIMRLATFEALYKEVGDVKAARIAKDLTTNFTRKGFNSSSMGMFYLFFNATVQGNAQVIKNMMKSKKLVGMVAGTIAMSATFDALGRAIGDDDEEGVSEWDKIPVYEKERNIILPIKIGGEFVKIPAPWVYNVVWRMGGMLSENAAGIRTAADTGVDTITMLLNTFNPLGGGSFAQGISPTALDPIIQVVENKNFAGNPLRPINFPGAGSKPDAELAWRNTPEIYKGLSRTLNEATGGDIAHSGWADISPSTFQNTVNFFGAGLLKFMTSVSGLPSTLSEDEIKTKNIPILSQFAAVPSDRMNTQKYYDRVKEVASAEKAIKEYGRGETKDLDKQKKAKEEYKEVLRMSSQVKDTERQLRSLRVRLNAARARGDDKTEKTLEERISSVRRRFNGVWNKRVRD